MGVADDLKNDLPVAMTMAAFMGIAWYISVELNIRLFLTFLRKRGLYFWSCCIGSWGVLTQPLFMVRLSLARTRANRANNGQWQGHGRL